MTDTEIIAGRSHGSMSSVGSHSFGSNAYFGRVKSRIVGFAVGTSGSGYGE